MQLTHDYYPRAVLQLCGNTVTEKARAKILRNCQVKDSCRHLFTVFSLRFFFVHPTLHDSSYGEQWGTYSRQRQGRDLHCIAPINSNTPVSFDLSGYFFLSLMIMWSILEKYCKSYFFLFSFSFLSGVYKYATHFPPLSLSKISSSNSSHRGRGGGYRRGCV